MVKMMMPVVAILWGGALCAGETAIIGFHGAEGDRDATECSYGIEAGKFRFRFAVKDATVCAPVDRQAPKRGLEDFDRVELFFSPTADMSKPYVCLEVGANGSVLDYRATYYRHMDYRWGFQSLNVGSVLTADGYVVTGAVDVAELAAEGIDPNRFWLGAFRADFAPGCRLVDWYAAVPQGPGEPDFHRPQLLFPVSGLTQVVYHVDATRGDDAAVGTATAPFRTPARARDAVRRLKQLRAFPKDGVGIELHGRFSSTSETILELTDEDSGVSDAAPIVWRAGRDGALFTGSIPISTSAFHPLAAADGARLRPEVRSRVRVCDLAPLGVGSLSPLPKCFRRWESEELFADGKALPVARYPNHGWMTIDKVLDSGAAPVDPTQGEFMHGVRGGKFVANDAEVGRWQNAKDAVLFGFWCWDWHGDFLQIASIDPSRLAVTLAAPSLYGIGHVAEWQKSKIRYRALNLLEEMDVPGEWYLDRASRRLYCIPPEAGLKDVELALSKRPLVSGRKVRYVRFEGLKFRYAIGCAVELKDCESTTLEGLDVQWLTTDGVRLSNARNCTVCRCRIAHIGTTALSVSGGDRRTLAKSGNVIADNDLGHSGRLARIDGKCLSFGGCGIVVEHNYIHDTPYICIAYGGNEHLFQYNHVECAMLEAGDGAGVYTGRDWGSRGNVLRWNYFNAFGKDGVQLRKRQGFPCDFEPLTGDIMVEGVYLDDCDSGEEIYGNIFHQAGRAMFTGGGRDNRWHHNLVIGCRSAVFLDTRGLERARPGTKVRDGWDLLQKIEQFNYKEEPWCSRYPSLVTTMENDPLLPMGTAYFENIAIGCETFFNCQGLAYGMLRTTLENRGNISVNQTDRKRDLGDYPQQDPTSRAKLEFRDNSELTSAAAVDPLNVQDASSFRAEFPNFPRIPVEKIGRRQRLNE